MAGNTPDKSPSFELISKSEGLEGLIKTLVSGEGIDVGDTILAYLGISREVLDEDQEAAVDALEEAVNDALNGRLRHGQALFLRGAAEEIRDIHCYTQPESGEEELQGSLKRLVGMFGGIIKQEGEALEALEKQLREAADFGGTLVLGEQQIADEGSVQVAVDYVLGILREKNETKAVVVEKVMLPESGLFNLIKALLAAQLAKICNVRKQAFSSANEEALLRQLVSEVIRILVGGKENKAELIQTAISAVAAAIKSEQTRSRVADVVSGTGEEPEVNFMFVSGRTSGPKGNRR